MSISDTQGSSSESKLISPPLKWAGGKRWLVPFLQRESQLFNNRRLVEPFAGGLAVALGLCPRQALLNDSNSHLINFYRQITKGLLYDLEFGNDKEQFYLARDKFNQLIKSSAGQNSAEAAKLFYYLNRTCFNGLCRFNNSGQFNVPFGRYKKINYLTNFFEYQEIFGGWEFSCADFEALVLRESDILYVDPPYDVEFTHYSKVDFKWDDQLRLVAWLKRLSLPMIVSNQASERILDLYRSAGFAVEIIEAPRRISSNGNRQPALEMIAHRNLDAVSAAEHVFGGIQ
jgi:DNA adenine methylase